METIQQLMLADGAILGFASIPLMYLTTTSTTRFLTLIRYALESTRLGTGHTVQAWAGKKQYLWSLRVIEPKQAK